MTQKERNSKSYKKRKENGLCPMCGKKLDRKGHYCSECLTKSNEYSRETREFCRKKHICTQCRKERVYGMDKICFECRAKKDKYREKITDEQRKKYNERFQEQQNTLYQQRAEKGICTRCGKRKAANGKKKCGICLEKDAEIHRRKYLEKPNIRKYRQENHLCYFCGGEIEGEKKNVCNACSEARKRDSAKGNKTNNYWKQDNRLIFMKR